jgi:hypothetical protein
MIDGRYIKIIEREFNLTYFGQRDELCHGISKFGYPNYIRIFDVYQFHSPTSYQHTGIIHLHLPMLANKIKQFAWNYFGKKINVTVRYTNGIIDSTAR